MASFWQLSLLLVTLFALYHTSNGISPPPPTNLPTAFYDPGLTFGFVGNETVPGEMWYDVHKKASRIDFSFAFFEGNPINFTTIALNASNYLLMNDLCRELASDGGFQSFFSWLPAATYNGQVTIGGRLCNEWVLNLGSKGVLVLDVDVNTTSSGVSIPVRFIAPGGSPVQASSSIQNSTFLFSTQLVVGPVDRSFFHDPVYNNPTCLSPYICPAGPTIDEKIYLFHDADDYTLINTNVADQSGDVAFVCLALETSLFSYFSWVSEYTISLNTTWGVYGFCNFGTCVGGAQDRVGKEAAEGVTDFTGQCNNNTNYGNWFSLPPPSDEYCPTYNQSVIGINGSIWYGCGWSIVEKTKTINGSCLQDNGFIEACNADGDFPFPTAQKVWAAAFASEDPTQGGCPAIGPSSLSAPASTVSPSAFSHSQNHRQVNQLLSMISKTILTPAMDAAARTNIRMA